MMPYFRVGLIVQSVSMITKDIFVWIEGPWHSVNYFNCAVHRYSYLLTYLLKIMCVLFVRVRMNVIAVNRFNS